MPKKTSTTTASEAAPPSTSPKTTVLKENLSAALKHTLKCVGKDSVLPILSHVLLQAEAGRLKIACTNLELATTTWIGAKVHDDFAIAVPAKTFNDIIGLLPDVPVDLTYDLRTCSLTIQSGEYKSHLKGLPAEDFPIIPSVGASVGTGFELPADQLREALRRTIFAASTEDNRPILTGLLFKVVDGNLVIAATDGFRLAKALLPAANIPPDLSVIVPAHSCQHLMSLLKDGAVTVSILNHRNQIGFRTADGSELVSALIEGTFPEYETIIPKSHSVFVHTEPLRRACRSADVFARENGRTIKIAVQARDDHRPSGLTIQSSSAETGNHHSFVDAVVEGEPLDIAFNVKYLLDVLDLGDEQLWLEMTTPVAPAVLRPAGEAASLFVLMPMRFADQKPHSPKPEPDPA